jgi:hypothetical protein
MGQLGTELYHKTISNSSSFMIFLCVGQVSTYIRT